MVRRDNLAIFLASVHDQARCFNWQCLIMVPIDDGTTRNILTHYGQVSLENHKDTRHDLRQHSYTRCSGQ